MFWTKEKPTQPGFYWFRRAGCCEVVEVRVYAHEGVAPDALFTGIDTPECMSVIDGEWAGPIPEPSDRAEVKPTRILVSPGTSAEQVSAMAAAYPGAKIDMWLL